MTAGIKYIPVKYISESHFQECDSEGAYGNPPVRCSNQLSNFAKRYFHQKLQTRGWCGCFHYYRQSECLIISTSYARLEPPLYPPPPPQIDDQPRDRLVMRVIPACPVSKWSSPFSIVFAEHRKLERSLYPHRMWDTDSTPANMGKNTYLPPSNLHYLFSSCFRFYVCTKYNFRGVTLNLYGERCGAFFFIYYTLYSKSDLCIPRNETVWPCSQYLRSCICEWFI